MLNVFIIFKQFSSDWKWNVEFKLICGMRDMTPMNNVEITLFTIKHAVMTCYQFLVNSYSVEPAHCLQCL